MTFTAESVDWVVLFVCTSWAAEPPTAADAVSKSTTGSRSPYHLEPGVGDRARCRLDDRPPYCSVACEPSSVLREAVDRLWCRWSHRIKPKPFSQMRPSAKLVVVRGPEPMAV